VCHYVTWIKDRCGRLIRLDTVSLNVISIMLLAAVYIISIFSVELFIIHKHLQLISYAFTGKPVSPDNGGLDTFLENTDGNI